MFDADRRLTVAFSAKNRCLCCDQHTPQPLTVELHHVFPQEYQKILYKGTVPDQRMIPLCGTAHNNIHVYIELLLAGKSLPLGARGYIREMAIEGVRRYRAAEAALKAA